MTCSKRVLIDHPHKGLHFEGTAYLKSLSKINIDLEKFSSLAHGVIQSEEISPPEKFRRSSYKLQVAQL